MQIENLLVSVLIVVILLFTRRILISLIAKNVKDPKTVYNSKRIIGYGYAFLLIILLGSVWITGFGSIGAYLGIASAGIAIALHESIANIAGWFFMVLHTLEKTFRNRGPYTDRRHQGRRNRLEAVSVQPS